MQTRLAAGHATSLDQPQPGLPTRCPSRGQCSKPARHVAARALDFTPYRGAVPPSFQQPGVVPGKRTVVTPRLTPEKVFERLSEVVDPHAAQHFGAFFSSVLGGIVTHPGYMTLHFHDHLVHCAHGVSDTIVLADGHLYQLDQHVARLVASAGMAGIDMQLSVDGVKRIILDTAAASLRMNGMAKVYVTAGRGAMSLSHRSCAEPAMYVLVSSEAPDFHLDRTQGWRVVPAALEPHGDYLGAIPRPSLRDVVVTLDAEANGADAAVYLGPQDEVLGGPDFTVAMITQQDVFVYPPFDGACPGITVQRLAELIPQEADQDLPLTGVEQRVITAQELLGAKEVVAMSSALGVMPVTHFGDTAIGDGTAGALALALNAVLDNDQAPKEGSALHVPVPYGMLTGMKSQLL